MEHDAIGPVQVLGEDFGRRRPTSGRAGWEHHDASAPAFRHEDIAIRCNADDAGCFRPLANTCTAKPFGTFGILPCGASTTFANRLKSGASGSLS
jgi:hypothetical protein